MRFKQLSLIIASLLLIAGCKSRDTTPAPASTEQASSPALNSSSSGPAGQPAQMPPSAAEVKPKIDACALLASKEINLIQGEDPKETKLSGHSAGGLNISQCFFTLPTFTNSISLLVAQKEEGTNARDPKKFWQENFHEGKGKGREREPEREKGGGGEKEEEGAPPRRVSGVGDEAYWVGSPFGGALYVLKGNSYVRVSIGGPADQANKIKKSKALAQKVIPRL